MTDAEARIAELEAKLSLLEERWALNEEVDALAEVAIRDRLPLDHSMRLLMPALCRAVSASVAFVRTYDETLTLHDFVHGTGEGASLPIDVDALCRSAEAEERVCLRGPGWTVLAQRIDVAGDPFGAAAIVVPEELGDARASRAASMLETWCEEIDNHLASIADARKKALLVRAMSDALKEPVLETGLAQAIEVLRANVPFEDMLLVFRHEDDVSGASLRYKIIKSGVVLHDSAIEQPGGDVDAFMRSHAFRLMSGDDEEVRERFGIRRYREEVMITGVRSARVVGRVVITSRRGEFNTFDRDLLERFADFLRQRIVDFNREWKNLGTTFPKDVCERLLREEGYTEKYLSPRERECAVMFCDISGFTRVCEQVLVKPQAIGRLVDTWSERVVQIVWESGGVFDKMVGDCVIGLWGPPFFDRDGKELCRRAAVAARRIRDFTRSLVSHEQLPELVGREPLDVATGLHYCPLFVGIFGPDADYTGFSAGMNNTARLQGQAKGGEILVMEEFAAKLGEPSWIGEWREANVKNVARPLRFAALKD